jgi:hypothetical protein
MMALLLLLVVLLLVVVVVVWPDRRPPRWKHRSVSRQAYSRSSECFCFDRYLGLALLVRHVGRVGNPNDFVLDVHDE